MGTYHIFMTNRITYFYFSILLLALPKKNNTIIYCFWKNTARGRRGPLALVLISSPFLAETVGLGSWHQIAALALMGRGDCFSVSVCSNGMGFLVHSVTLKHNRHLSWLKGTGIHPVSPGPWDSVSVTFGPIFLGTAWNGQVLQRFVFPRKPEPFFTLQWVKCYINHVTSSVFSLG